MSLFHLRFLALHVLNTWLSYGMTVTRWDKYDKCETNQKESSTNNRMSRKKRVKKHRVERTLYISRSGEHKANKNS